MATMMGLSGVLCHPAPLDCHLYYKSAHLSHVSSCSTCNHDEKSARPSEKMVLVRWGDLSDAYVAMRTIALTSATTYKAHDDFLSTKQEKQLSKYFA
jgi:hypothetical protein